jgi:hypothetical protein
MEHSVPKRRHIKLRRREITQKNEYNIKNKVYVLNKEGEIIFLIKKAVCYTCSDV